MALFKRNKQPQTKIIRRAEERPQAEPVRAAVFSVLHTQRWQIKRDEFRGFESPPGRF